MKRVEGKKEFHEGRWLRDRIAETGMNVSAFARENKFILQTVTRWLRQQKIRIRREREKELAESLDYDSLADWDRAKIQASEEFDLANDPRPVAPPGVYIDSAKGTKVIPKFDLPIAAEPLRETFTDDASDGIAIPSGSGDLALTIRGDCMEPDFKEGDTVVFWAESFAKEGLRAGKCYYVQLLGGTSTFKRVLIHPSDPEKLILSPINIRYRTARTKKTEIVKMMRAVRKIVEL